MTCAEFYDTHAEDGRATLAWALENDEGGRPALVPKSWIARVGPHYFVCWPGANAEPWQEKALGSLLSMRSRLVSVCEKRDQGWSGNITARSVAESNKAMLRAAKDVMGGSHANARRLFDVLTAKIADIDVGTDAGHRDISPSARSVSFVFHGSAGVHWRTFASISAGAAAHRASVAAKLYAEEAKRRGDSLQRVH